MTLDKILYTAHVAATGGRAGSARSSDGALDVSLAKPTVLGGAGGGGTNPEQLFAAGYAACFIGAMKTVAAGRKLALPAEVSIESEVSVGPIEVGLGIQVAMTISIPGMDKAAVERLVADAHRICPYSNATRGNVDVRLAVA
ncbi:MAG TPA: organic hydroperoxide resistance protein [Burkholderiaceae bacterium]